jgi:hypothetical protein
MSLTSKLLSASGGGITYVDDVFSAYTYTGNGATQTINNGIDLTGKGGLVWLKGRSNASRQNTLIDSARGASKNIYSNLTNNEGTVASVLTSFNSNGFSIDAGIGNTNGSGETLVSWTFRKAPKFFDVVTYTGTGVNRTVPHSLNSEVGTLIVKRTDTAADWQVFHRSAANTEYLVLNSTAAKATGATRWNSTTPSTGSFSLGTDVTVNANGGTYVAYLYAHDTTADSIVQCGSFSTDSNGFYNVNLGWEPQYVIIKTSSGVGDWRIADIARGLNTDNGVSKGLYANTSNTEDSNVKICPSATGFFSPFATPLSTTFIYIAIRRSNKPPTVGTEVYNAIARTGTGADTTVTGVGFAPDLAIIKSRSAASYPFTFNDRLRGIGRVLQTNNTSAESGTYGVTAYNMDGVSFDSDVWFNASAGGTYINYFFKRAVGIFDEVCYTGTGSATTLQHGLGAVPELMIVKVRNGSSYQWVVYHSGLGNGAALFLNQTNTPYTDTIIWNSTTPTASVFSIGTYTGVNSNSTSTYVAYLFASKAGISSCFSYTGNGSSQTIDCGFTTGARFFLVKSTSVAGSWWVYDSVRGISAPADPALQLNSTAAEITTADAVDPHFSGVIVNQEATCSINANGVTYIGLAFA